MLSASGERRPQLHTRQQHADRQCEFLTLRFLIWKKTIQSPFF